jgi:hypothetical protein
MKSWKTTVAGIAAIVASVAAAIVAEFDGDPATTAEWGVVITAFIAGIGLLFARDNAVSSEEAGAK